LTGFNRLHGPGVERAPRADIEDIRGRRGGGGEKLEMTVMQEHVKSPPKFVAAFKRVAEVDPSTLAPQFSTNFIVGRLPYNAWLCLSSFSFALHFLFRIHSVT
jgi:hypothetical protein